MIIREIELRDWGRHKLLKQTMDTHVVGILGANGCGKSTFLKAIDFAFTGTLDRKQETYIRNFGTETGATSASVKVKFVKGGLEGTITRRIGSGASRSLYWDGQEYTKAKDVDAIMATIFNADKSAISSAIFVGQGELDRLISGTMSERETLFTKLMNISFLEARVVDLYNKITALTAMTHGSSNVDSAIDAAKKQKKELEESLKELSTELAGQESAENLQLKIKNVDTCINYVDQYKGYSQKLTRMGAALEDMQLVTDLWLTKTLPRYSYTQLEQLVASFTESIAKSKECLSACRLLIEKIKYTKKCKELLTTTQEELEILQNTTIPSLENNIILQFPDDVVDNSIAVAKGKIEKYTEYAISIKQRMEAESTLDSIMVQWQNTLKRSTENDGKKAMLQLFRKEEQLLTEKINNCKLRAQFAEHIQATGSCPVCNSDHLDKDAYKQDIILENKQKLEIARENEVKRITAFEKECTDFDTNLLILDARLKEAKEVVNKIHANADENCPASLELCVTKQNELSEELESSLNLKEEMHKLRNDISIAKLQEEKAKLLIEHCNQQLESAPTGTEEEELQNLSRLEKSIESDSEVLEALKDRLSLHTKSKSAIATLQTDREETHKAVISQFENIKEFYTEPFDSSVDHVSELGILKEAFVQESLQNAQKLGEYKQLNTALQNTIDNLDQLKQQADKTQSIRDVITELTEVRMIISKGGLPTIYMNTVFSALASIVQDVLSSMRPNFCVKPDPERPVSFLFQRTDSEDEAWMPQEQLSGGQKVRLALALLIACQRLLLPDVGFMVLDEPSSHIDKEGVDSLGELFRNLTNTLASTQSQIIVVDHNDALNTCFDKLIKL